MTNLTNSNGSLFAQKIHPFKQGAIALGVGISLLIFGGLFSSMGMHLPDRFAWMIGGATILLFSLFNSILALSATNSSEYWGKSIATYIVIVAVVSLLAWAITGKSLSEAGSFKWIYTVLTFAYLTFISIMNAVKKIVTFAQKEEWHHPRLRVKNRKKRKL